MLIALDGRKRTRYGVNLVRSVGLTQTNTYDTVSICNVLIYSEMSNVLERQAGIAISVSFVTENGISIKIN